MLNSEHGIYPAYKCVGILTFIGRINTIIESLKARKNQRNSFFYKQLKLQTFLEHR